MNRNIVISIALGLILIAVIGGYFVFYKSGPISPAPETINNQTSTLPSGTPKPTAIDNTEVTSTSTPISIGSEDELKSIVGFYQLTNRAIGGATTGTSTGTSSHDVLFIDKATSHIYKTSVTERRPNRLTSTTIPRVNQVWWGSNKKDLSILINHTDKDGANKWFNALMKNASSSDGELIGSDLDQNITSLDISPDGKNIIYLKPDNENTVGTLHTIESGKKTQVFKSIFKDWNVSWGDQGSIVITSKPAAGITGLALTLTPQTQQTKTILEGIPGLTLLMSSDSRKTLFSSSRPLSNIEFFVYDLIKKTSTNLKLSTLPEKCVWAKNNITIYCGVPNQPPMANYPDDWYSGEIGFNDTIWKINTDTNEAIVLVNPELDNLRQPIDVYQPFLSSDEKYLYLTNKHDLTLWALDLTQEF